MRLSPITTLDMKTGAEGPRHDPYGYTQLIFTRGDLEVVIHRGLDVRIELNGCKVDHPPFISCEECKWKWMKWQWKQLTGIDYNRAEKYVIERDNPSKCKKCGSRKFESVNGFPGETLQICSKCDTIVASHLNMSAII